MKIRIFIITILIAMIMTGGAFAGGSKDTGSITLKKGVLSIGMEIGYPPMEYYAEDGKTPIGFDVEMGRAIAGKLGLTPNFVDTSWDGIFAGVNSNKYDCIISAVTINPQRLAAHNFSKPYLENNLAMVIRKDSRVTARTPEECSGLAVAFQVETTSETFMEELASEGLRYTARKFDKVMYCFDELRLGRVDAVITDLPVATDYVSSANSPFEIVWVSPVPEKFGICLKKGNDELTAALNKALDELFADGTLRRISQKYFDADLVSQVWNTK